MLLDSIQNSFHCNSSFELFSKQVRLIAERSSIENSTVEFSGKANPFKEPDSQKPSSMIRPGSGIETNQRDLPNSFRSGAYKQTQLRENRKDRRSPSRDRWSSSRERDRVGREDKNRKRNRSRDYTEGKQALPFIP